TLTVDLPAAVPLPVSMEASAMPSFSFDPLAYPVAGNKRYQGRFRFAKHYYRVLAKLKDGGEEWRRALAIDRHPRARHWGRNLDSDPSAGFRLPSSFGRFYPDFVCELTEGGLFVVEYKGEQIRGVAKEIEKAQVESSGGHCLFAFIYRQAGGMNVSQ